MTIVTATDVPSPSTEADDQFHSLVVRSVRREANDTTSLIFDIPDALRQCFSYRAGQYLTLRVNIGGKHLYRCYSMSTAPETERHLRVTAKCVPGGRVSSWINSAVKPGDRLDVMPPAGRFCLRERTGALVLLGGGSGITPLLSLAKSALATTERKVTLVYANRDRESIIFAEELDSLARANPGRFELVHWLDAERGLIDSAALRALGVFQPGADYYICGPDAFMTIAENAALGAGVNREHVFIERFVSPPDEEEAPGLVPQSLSGAAGVERCETVTVVLRGQKRQFPHQPGETVMETARRGGLRPPFSCLAGQCATCMAKVKKGAVSMKANHVLTEEEIKEGYVLTCQAVPISKELVIDYEQ